MRSASTSRVAAAMIVSSPHSAATLQPARTVVNIAPHPITRRDIFFLTAAKLVEAFVDIQRPAPTTRTPRRLPRKPSAFVIPGRATRWPETSALLKEATIRSRPPPPLANPAFRGGGRLRSPPRHSVAINSNADRVVGHAGSSVGRVKQHVCGIAQRDQLVPSASTTWRVSLRS